MGKPKEFLLKAEEDEVHKWEEHGKFWKEWIEKDGEKIKERIITSKPTYYSYNYEERCYKNGIIHGDMIISKRWTFEFYAYKDGKKNGRFCKVNTYRGLVTDRCNYVDDKIEGCYQKFTPNTKTEITYVNGKKQGDYTVYSQMGDIIEFGFYNKNKKYVKEKYTTNIENFRGKLIEKNNYLDCKKHGICEKWYNDGTQMTKIEYVNGKKEGKCEEYFPDGKPKIICNYLNGKEEGKEEYYDENGNLSWVFNYVKGKREGKGEIYNDGKLYIVSNYLNDKKDREEIIYNEDGTITENFYVRGVLV